MLKKTELVIDFLSLVIQKGDFFCKQLCFKFLSSICRDNFAFLIDMPNFFIDFLFRVFSICLKFENWDFASMILDIFHILMFYRYKNIAENTQYICSKMMKLKNDPNDILNDLLINYLPAKLSSLDVEKNMQIVSFKNYKWQTFHSKQVEFYEMTSEKTPEFKVVKLDNKSTIGWKLLKLFESMSQLESPEIYTLLKSNLSLENL